MPPLVQNRTPDGSRPLQITDALDFLDAIKAEYPGNRDIYNQFLDIMKDFKRHVIDTPIVIDRVIRLFVGHLDLMQAFNTFLPPGYRVDISDPSKPDIVTITTPRGVTTQTLNRNLQTEIAPSQ